MKRRGKKYFDYCNEIMEAVRMGIDKSRGSMKRWELKYGRGEYLCSVVCGIIKKAQAEIRRRGGKP